jgi:glutaredoxin
MQLPRTLAAAGALFLAAAASLAYGDATAQQIYKIVGPDGRITFSDKPPADPAVKAKTAPVVAMTSGPNTAALPFELRQAATRYPVTIYTSPGCQTCAQGRSLLTSRGIPFAERSVASKEDGEALTRLAGTSNVPVLTIGAQQLRGFSDAEWTSFLDAAGYPKSSMLPASYSPPPATPLVALDTAPAQTAAPTAAAQAGANTRALAPLPVEQPPENPAGIKF